MQPFPAEHSVLVLDNCRIHHNEAIAELVQTAGVFRDTRADEAKHHFRLSYTLSSRLFSGFEPN
jgi:hypothetical protein